MFFHFLAGIIFIPLLVVVIVFAISNSQEISISLWPLPFMIEMPFYLSILIVGFVFFLFGGMIAWLPHVGVRHKLKITQKRVKDLEEDLKNCQKTTTTKNKKAIENGKVIDIEVDEE